MIVIDDVVVNEATLEGYFVRYGVKEWVMRGLVGLRNGKQTIIGVSCPLCMLPVGMDFGEEDKEPGSNGTCPHSRLEDPMEVARVLGVEEAVKEARVEPAIDEQRSIT